jgi:glucokinase
LKTALGADFGGTNRRLVCVDDSGVVLGECVKPTGPDRPADQLIEELVVDARQLTRDISPVGIGLALSGTVFRGGMQKKGMANLGQLAGLPMSKRVSEELSLACRSENDAQSAMRGECHFGAAKGRRNALSLTLGTGIGSGLLLDGIIRTGAHNSGGEIGLFSMPDGAKTWKSLEELVAPGRFPGRYNTTAEDLFQSLEQGKTDTRWEEFFDFVGAAISHAHLLLDLECVVLCGAVTSVGEPLRKGIEQAFNRHCPEAYRFGMEILLSQLGARAGAVGAATLFLKEADH